MVFRVILLLIAYLLLATHFLRGGHPGLMVLRKFSLLKIYSVNSLFAFIYRVLQEMI